MLDLAVTYNYTDFFSERSSHYVYDDRIIASLMLFLMMSACSSAHFHLIGTIFVT